MLARITVLFLRRIINIRIITPRKAAVIKICCVPMIFVYIAKLRQDDSDYGKAKNVPDKTTAP
jgi:hypothetical protein